MADVSAALAALFDARQRMAKDIADAEARVVGLQSSVDGVKADIAEKRVCVKEIEAGIVKLGGKL